RGGARHVAGIGVATQTAAYMLPTRHDPDPQSEYLRLSEIVAFALLAATGIWILYMAFEPYVRRFWPQLLIGWSRLLSGRVRDPLVGRDVLVGVTAGMIAGLLLASRNVIPYLLGLSVATPVLPVSWVFLGSRYAVAGALFTVLGALRNALQIVCVVVFLRILVRRNWIVFLLGTIAILPIAMSGSIVPERLAIGLTITVLGIALMFFVLLRFGLLALVVT